MRTLITLYRGDHTLIEKFHFTRTSRYGLYGPGIYLSDNEDIANTYRNKGARSRHPLHSLQKKTLLWKGHARNRLEAYEKALPVYWALKGHSNPFGESARVAFQAAPRKEQEQAWKSLQERVEQGSLVAMYGTYSGSRPQREISVILHRTGEAVAGYLSTFVFARDELQAGIIRVDREVRDTLLLDICAAYGVNLEKRFGELFIPQDLPNLVKLRRATSEFGYHGFEYTGGVATSSGVWHRAFVLWDEDFVNVHRVSCSRM